MLLARCVDSSTEFLAPSLDEVGWMWRKVILYALNFKRRFIVEMFPALLVLFLFGRAFVCFVLVWLFIAIHSFGVHRVFESAFLCRCLQNHIIMKRYILCQRLPGLRILTLCNLFCLEYLWLWLTKWMNLNSNEIYRLNMKCPWRCRPALWLKLTSFCCFGGERLSPLWTMHLFVWFRCESAVRLLCTRLVAPFSAIHSVFIDSFLSVHLSLIFKNSY